MFRHGDPRAHFVSFQQFVVCFPSFWRLEGFPGFLQHLELFLCQDRICISIGMYLHGLLEVRFSQSVLRVVGRHTHHLVVRLVLLSRRLHVRCYSSTPSCFVQQARRFRRHVLHSSCGSGADPTDPRAWTCDVRFVRILSSLVLSDVQTRKCTSSCPSQVRATCEMASSEVRSTCVRASEAREKKLPGLVRRVLLCAHGSRGWGRSGMEGKRDARGACGAEDRVCPWVWIEGWDGRSHPRPPHTRLRNV